ncbi:MAG: c-type cytochrome [Bacteroidia bacterium]|nr:c-type cytochrome [Bacteroidia bacterium]
MKKFAIVFGVFCLMLSAFTTLKDQIFVAPKNWPKPVYDFAKNPLTKEKVELGRALFYDPLLSGTNTISCASCHSQFTAFTHVDHALSHGVEDRIGTRNSPALMNLAWHKLFMWDGAINHLDVQALAPVSHPDEMGEKIENVVLKLQQSKIYRKLFYEAFADSAATGERTLKAISQFMLTLISAESKYDSVMRKQSQFTTQEKNGYNIFQKNCSSCHKEPLFTNLAFENNGLPPDTKLKDIGRMKISKNPADSLRFKVPTLRNIEFSYPYMHDGRFKKLSEVINHYTSGIQHNKTLSKPLEKAIILTSNEKVDLVAFLLTLTDKKFLFDQRFSYPKEIFFPKPKD